MKDILNHLFQGGTLSEDEAYALMGRISEKAFPDAQVAALLTVFRMRSITAGELLGLRRALVERAVPIDLSAYAPIDIVGTGGDGKNTFNISTCSAFVVAGAGYRVAKHGNYGATSVSGASTVLEQHGVRFTNDAGRLEQSIDASGVAYLHAPLFHPALAAVGPVRRALGVATAFNLLGPLVNPCKPACQMLGVARLDQMRLYVQALTRLGLGFTVVNGLDGYDEVSLTGAFKMVSNHYECIFSPQDLGLTAVSPEQLAGGATPADAAAIFDAVLEQRATTAQSDCVTASAAVAISTICPEQTMDECLAEARESLASGRALQAFRRFVEINAA